MGDQVDPHDHMSDDSCSTKREDDDGEGIYASTARKRTFSERSGHIETDQGLTMQPTEQSSDPQPPHDECSMTDAQMQDSFWDWVDDYEPPNRRPRDRTRTPSVSTPFSCKNRTKASLQPLPDDWWDEEPQPSTEQQLSDVPAPRSDQEETLASRTTSVSHPPFSKKTTKASRQPVQSDCFARGSQPSTEQQLSDVPPPRSDQEENSASRTPSVSHLAFNKNQTKVSRQPAQSDCFASGRQTPERSETPPTPVDHGNASCDLFGDEGETQETSEVDHQQHPVAIGATLPKSQSLPGDGACQATQGPFQKIPVVDLTEESRIASSSLRNRHRYAYLRASSTWNCNTPLPSIEGYRFPDRTLPSTPNNPFESQLAAQSNINSAASGKQSPEHVAFATQHKRGQNGEAIAKNREYREKEPANQHKQRIHTTTNPSAAQFDPSSSQFFATFMKLRNSLPLSAAMAIMAPANQNQVLSTLAEMSNAQGFTNKPGDAQTATHEVPAAMRGMLDNLKRKFDSDKSFLQSVIVYVTEQLIKDGKIPSLTAFNCLQGS
jgi:hypothetical protein